jgi:Zn-finger nucleic acid-binding protein
MRPALEAAMNLTCVKCTSVLDKATVGGIEVDLCPACGGLWLDAGEIERLGFTAKPQVDDLRHALTGGQQAGLSETPTNCPACPGTLTEVTLGTVAIEYCQRCRGVFLDKGELDAAMAAVRGTTVDQVLALAASVRG